METNRLIIALLFCASLLGAQEYYVKKEDGGQARIYQKLAWQKEENALRYEVVIQQLWEEAYETERTTMWGFVEIKREFTADSFIEVSLSPGKYRIMVTAYDLLDRPGIPSEWASLEILKAQVPELLEFSPGIFYLDSKPPWVLAVQGLNIIEGAEISLRPLDKKGKVIVPKEYTITSATPLPDLPQGSDYGEDAEDSLAEAETETGSLTETETGIETKIEAETGAIVEETEDFTEQPQQVFVFFDENQLAVGKYELVIKNPGGFEVNGNPFEIKIKNKFTYFFKRLFRKKTK
jgi:hypothetical protein